MSGIVTEANLPHHRHLGLNPTPTRKNGSQKDEPVNLITIVSCYTKSNLEVFNTTFEYAGRVMLRLQIALWVRLRYVRASLVKDSRPHGSCAVSRICSAVIQQFSSVITRQ